MGCCFSFRHLVLPFFPSLGWIPQVEPAACPCKASRLILPGKVVRSLLPGCIAALGSVSLVHPGSFSSKGSHPPWSDPTVLATFSMCVLSLAKWGAVQLSLAPLRFAVSCKRAEGSKGTALGIPKRLPFNEQCPFTCPVPGSAAGRAAAVSPLSPGQTARCVPLAPPLQLPSLPPKMELVELQMSSISFAVRGFFCFIGFKDGISLLNSFTG